MYRNVVIGVADHAGGRDALALAGRLSSADAARIFAYVQVHAERHRPGDAAETREDILARLRAAGAEAGIDGVLQVVASSSPGRGLHELAEQVGADLLVVGSTRRGLLGRVLLGDDTNAALNGAPCAVAVAPVGYAQAPRLIREIGVGYDGSPESEHALACAQALAAELGARVSACEVIALPRDPFTGGVAAFDADAIDALLAEARQRIGGLGVEPHAVYGFPAEELGLYSASVDLLVVGSRGYGPVRRVVQGSTSRYLARTARSPLLVLTRAEP